MFITITDAITIISIMVRITYTLSMAFIIITSIRVNITKLVCPYLENLQKWYAIKSLGAYLKPLLSDNSL